MVSGSCIRRKIQLTTVHASLVATKRKRLWGQLAKEKPVDDTPWVMGGDFNALLADNERVGGAESNGGASRLFREFVFDTQVTDIGCRGPPFTWTRGILQQRLDICLVSPSWLLYFSEAYDEHLERLGSYHHPLLLDLSELNFISALRNNDDNWITDQDELAVMAKDFFTKLFTCELRNGHRFPQHGRFPHISGYRLRHLGDPLSNDEMSSMNLSWRVLKIG
ncbi:hypothetical protein V6N11_001547 [Hibiscus sabdariffa]|uniref:Endonuclease/exonuclease/phosphatase domain-containing protein n=1 Tax=Hibiscus sabdariffa TaxID=183260 RepID=A0ABR2S0M7_9ROSI